MSVCGGGSVGGAWQRIVVLLEPIRIVQLSPRPAHDGTWRVFRYCRVGKAVAQRGGEARVHDAQNQRGAEESRSVGLAAAGDGCREETKEGLVLAYHKVGAGDGADVRRVVERVGRLMRRLPLFGGKNGRVFHFDRFATPVNLVGLTEMIETISLNDVTA